MSKVLLSTCVLTAAVATSAEAADTPRKLFVGGKDAKRNAYPWYTVMTTDADRFVDSGCGGVLVAPDMLLFLRAGRCDSYRGFFDEGATQVRVGLLCADLSNNCGQDFEDATVTEEFTFDGCCDPYQEASLHKLDRSVTTLEPVVPDDGTGYVLAGAGGGVAVGFGNFKSRPPNSSFRVQDRSVDLVDLKSCERDFNIANFGDLEDEGPPESLVCVSSENGGMCEGDEGSVIVLPGAASNGGDVLVGLVDDNFDKACDNPQEPDLAVRVGFIFDWIKETVCEESDDPPFWCTEPPLECEESPRGRFIAPTTKNCRWLKRMLKTSPEMVASICSDHESTARTACPETCAICSA